MENKNNVTVGFNWVSVLGIAFVVLKLCHVIDWSWWWVTVPFWGGLAILIVVLIILAILAAIFD